MDILVIVPRAKLRFVKFEHYSAVFVVFAFYSAVDYKRLYSPATQQSDVWFNRSFLSDFHEVDLVSSELSLAKYGLLATTNLAAACYVPLSGRVPAAGTK